MGGTAATTRSVWTLVKLWLQLAVLHNIGMETRSGVSIIRSVLCPLFSSEVANFRINKTETENNGFCPKKAITFRNIEELGLSTSGLIRFDCIGKTKWKMIIIVELN